jgi:hypothetical protein
MSTESDQARLIAERVARRLSDTPTSSPIKENASNNLSGELAAMRTGLNELQKRLAQIEAKVRAEETTASSPAYAKPIASTTRPVPLTHSPWLAGVNASIAHPSQERFGVEEATISELVDFFEKEKTCGVEPGGKPCDHCAMCSSRGF